MGFAVNMKTPDWWPGAALAFDEETTGPNPAEDRIVTAHAVMVGEQGATGARSWLISPGVKMSDEVIAIHGITNEKAATGALPRFAIPDICQCLEAHWASGLPLIAFNASFDLTMLVHERARLGLPEMKIGPVIDPFVIDRAVDKYRSGKRRLAEMCAHYGVRQERGHSADGDALAAARLVWKMLELPEIGHLTLHGLQLWQAEKHAERQDDYRRYLIREGKPGAEKVDGSWPIQGRFALLGTG